MASVMGDSDLRRLEREAENARARLHETIAEIRDPRTIDNAKLEMKHRANEVKDRALEFVRERRDDAMESGRSQWSDFSRRVQMNAMNNPWPVLMIGAGLGWRLWKRPPVTSVLIGTGLWQLFKNWDSVSDPDVSQIERPIAGVGETLTHAKDAVAARVSDVADRVQASVQPVIERAAPLFDEDNRARLGMLALMAGAGLCVGGLLRNSQTAQRMMDEARETARNLGESISELGDEMVPVRSAQDMAAEHPLLLSIMGVAIGAVLGGMIRQMPTAGAISDRATQVAESLRETVTGEMPQHREAQAQRDRVMVHSH